VSPRVHDPHYNYQELPYIKQAFSQYLSKTKAAEKKVFTFSELAQKLSQSRKQIDASVYSIIEFKFNFEMFFHENKKCSPL